MRNICVDYDDTGIYFGSLNSRYGEVGYLNNDDLFMLLNDLDLEGYVVEVTYYSVDTEAVIHYYVDLKIGW